LLLFIIVSFVQLSITSADFNDITDSHYNASAILYLQETGVLTGYSDGTFKPDNKINRAEFVKIVVHSILRKVPERPTVECFPDVKIEQWFAPYVCYAKSIGIISGYEDGTFRPEKNISFVESAKIIVHAFQFTTVEDRIWYRPYVEKLSSQNAIPITISRFDYVISRGEMSEMMYRLLADVRNKTSRTYNDLDPSSTLQTSITSKYSRDQYVLEKRLPNGFTYFYRFSDRPNDAVHLELVVKAGSAHEEKGKYGIAHFLEHMVFNGTESFSEGDIFKYMASIGAPLGADTNATTGPDRTSYRLRVPNTSDEFRQGIKILSEFAGKAVFDSVEIDRERLVVFEEMRRNFGRTQRFLDMYLPSVFPKSSYNHAAIGIEKDIYSISRDDLFSFYKKWYRPDNMALVIVGDISEREVDEMIQEYFSAFQNPPDSLVTDHLIEPDQNETTYFRFSDPESTHGTFGISFRIPSPMLSNRQSQKDMLALQYLLKAINNRFDDFYATQNQNVVYMNTSFSPDLNSRYGVLDFRVSYLSSESTKVIPAFLQEIQRILSFGISDLELRSARNVNAGILEFAKLDSELIYSSDVLKSISNAYWKGDIILSLEDHATLLREVNREINADYVSELIKRIFENKNRMIFLELPEVRLHEISTNKIREWMDNMHRNSLDRYDPVQSGGELLVTGSGTILDQSILRSDLGMTRTEFENGLVLRTKKTNFEPNAVYVRMNIRGGHLFLPPGQQYLDDFLAEALMDGGTLHKSLREFQSYSRDHQLSLSLNSGLVQFFYTGYSPVSNFENLLTATRELLFEPAFEETGLKKSREKLLQRRAISLRDPESFFQTRYDQMLFQDATHTLVPSVDEISNYSKEQLMNLHRKYFVPGNIEMNVVGNIDEKLMIDLVSKYFGTLPKTDVPQFNETFRSFRFPSGLPLEELKIGSEQKATTLMVFKGVHDLHEDFLKWKVLSLILTERLTDRIREDLGGTYSIQADLFPFYYMNGGTLEISFDSDPLKVYDFFRESISIMNELKTNGVSQSELKRAVEPLKVEFDTGLQKNNFWFYLGDEFNNVPYTLFHDRRRELEKLTIVDINDVAKSLDLQNYFRMVLLPQK